MKTETANMPSGYHDGQSRSKAFPMAQHTNLIRLDKKMKIYSKKSNFLLSIFQIKWLQSILPKFQNYVSTAGKKRKSTKLQSETLCVQSILLKTMATKRPPVDSDTNNDFCCCLVAKLCLTLCDSMGCGPPGLSVHGIPQAHFSLWVWYCCHTKPGHKTTRTQNSKYYWATSLQYSREILCV